MNLLDIGEKIKSLIEQNPTPMGALGKAVAPVVQSTQNWLQRFPTPMSYIQTAAPQPQGNLMQRWQNTPVLPFIPQSTLSNLGKMNAGVFEKLPQPAYSGIPALQIPGMVTGMVGQTSRLIGGQASPMDIATAPLMFMGSTKSINPAREEATQRLRNLLTYDKDMQRLGYSVKNIPDVKTGINMLAKELPQYYNKQAIDEAMLKEIGADSASWLTKVFKPLRGLTPDLQEAIAGHHKAINVAKVDADTIAKSFTSNLPPSLEWKLVQWSQNPTTEIANKLGLTLQDIEKGMEIVNKSRQFNDQLFAKARSLGVDVNYLQHHIYQIFKENPNAIEDILSAKGLGGKPGFAQHRAIPDFMKAQELGLTPKYTTFAQLNAAAAESLDKALANSQLAKILEKSGQLLPESQAPANWEKISARWFPKASVRVGRDNVMSQDWYAPRQLAGFLNNYFGGQQMGVGDKILSGLAKVSGGAQNIALSGGVGPLNFFGIGQLIKEGTAGRIITPLKAFFRTFIPGASQNWQAANRPLIREMASEGINIRGMETYQTMYKNIVDNPSIGEVIGKTWHTLMDAPTFGKFMNELQISFYKDAKDALIKHGVSDTFAIQKAAEATKLFYGLSNDLGRSQGVQDALTTVFLAPKYREGMLNIFANLAKSLKPGNFGQSEYAGIQKLALGMAMTYGMYNVAQKRLTGKYLWENPAGKEFELVIPVGDTKDEKYISVPWMPGFTALPRRILSGFLATAKGDVKEGLRQWGSLLSIPLSNAFALIANKDYFGNEIYDQNNPLPGMAMYGAKQFLPGYGRAALDVGTGKATPVFGLVEALELPIRKGTFSSGYYEAVDKAKSGLNSEERKQFEYMLTSDKKGGPSTEAEAEMMLKNEKLLNAKRITRLATHPNDPLWSRPIDDIKAYLAYQLADDTKVKAQIRVKNSWLPQVQFQLADQYYNDYEKKVTPSEGYDPQSLQGRLGSLLNPPSPYTGKPVEKPTASPMQSLTPEQVQIASMYTSLPQGSMQRKQLLSANPWLKTYWNENNQYYQNNPYEIGGALGEQLKAMGITTNMLASNSFSQFKKKPTVKVIKIKKAKAIKIAKRKQIKLTIKKAPKQKSIKIRNNLFTATRPGPFGRFV